MEMIRTLIAFIALLYVCIYALLAVIAALSRAIIHWDRDLLLVIHDVMPLLCKEIYEYYNELNIYIKGNRI